MLYKRTRWTGWTAHTSLVTSQRETEIEDVIIIEAYEDAAPDVEPPQAGLMQSTFKVAYVKEGAVSFCMQFNHQPPAGLSQATAGPWLALDDGPLYLYGTVAFAGAAPYPGTALNVVGNLNDPYPLPIGGRIAIWTLLPGESYQTWRYEDFWRLPMSPIFVDPAADARGEGASLPPLTESLVWSLGLGLGPSVNGWGHRYDTDSDQGKESWIVRTMIYSLEPGTEQRSLFMKSSHLELTEDSGFSRKAFETFLLV